MNWDGYFFLLFIFHFLGELYVHSLCLFLHWKNISVFFLLNIRSYFYFSDMQIANSFPSPLFFDCPHGTFSIYVFLKSDHLDFDRESKCVIVLCHNLKGLSEFKIINHEVDSSCNSIVSLPYLNHVFILNLLIWIYTIEYYSTQQWPHDWKKSVFIPIPKKGNAKECSNYGTIVLISHVSKIMIKILKVKLPQYVNQKLPDVHTWFQRSRGIRDQIDNICGSWRKQGSSRKASASTSLTTLKPLTIWITTNSAKFLKRWE